MRSSINDPNIKKGMLSKMRDKTPNIHSTALSMRIPTNNPQTVFNENSIGRLNEQEDSNIDTNVDKKNYQSTEINLANNSVVTPQEPADLDKKRGTTTIEGSNLENQFGSRTAQIIGKGFNSDKQYRSLNFKGQSHQATLTSLDHPLLAKKRDLVKNFQRIRIQNKLIQDGILFKRSKSGNKYKPTQMPGSGIFSYTNYKMTTKSNPYLGSILPDSNMHDSANSWKHMPNSFKGRTQSHVKQLNHNFANAGSGGRRKREIKDVIRKANEMDNQPANDTTVEGNLEFPINDVQMN